MGKVIRVKFDGGAKEYSYYVDDNLVLQEGDLCVVPAAGAFHVVTVTKIEGLSRHEIELAGKWVVQKVDLEAYHDAMKKRAIIQETKNKLRKRKQEIDELMLLKEYADHDPEIRALLERLRELDPSLVPQLEAPKKVEAETKQ